MEKNNQNYIEDVQIFSILLEITDKYLHFGTNFKTNLSTTIKLNSSLIKGNKGDNSNNGLDGSTSVYADIILDNTMM